MLQGDLLSEAVELNEALELCAADPNCSGVTSEWYIDSTFVAVSKTTDFAIDTASYGCSFAAVCSD